MNTKRITGILPVLSLFFLMGLATNAQATTYSFKSFNSPVVGTIAVAVSINDRGQVVGSYFHPDTQIPHGFMYSGGTFTSLDPPGATDTYAYSINDSGQVAGCYSDGSNHGFVYSEGKYTSLDVPGATSTAWRNLSVG